MDMINDNIRITNLPEWEQMNFAPATGIAGTNIVDDNKRYIYEYFQTSATAAQFWRYDTWTDTYQQLATPPTQTGTVANMTYTEGEGGQWSGRTFGAVYLFVGNGTICYLYRYNVATNTWSAALSTTGIPAAFATDCYLMHPGPSRNGWEGGYHSGVLRTITLGAGVAVGATTATVGALAEAMPSGARLRFGTFAVTLSAAVVRGATTLAVTALPQGIGAGTVMMTAGGDDVIVSSNVAAGATSVPVYPILRGMASGTVITVEQFVVLTAAAAAAATSITIAAALYTITTGSTAPYYGQMYLVGNNATVMYRYNKGANAWYTTSANSGNPAIPAVTGSAGAGCALKWLPAFALDKLWCLRGGATATAYVYDLVANSWTTETFYPNTETFTTGTTVASRSVAGKQTTLLIQKDATMRIYEGNPAKNTLEPAFTQFIYPTGAAVVGDKATCIVSPDGLEYYYMLLPSSAAFLRTLLLDR